MWSRWLFSTSSRYFCQDSCNCSHKNPSSPPWNNPEHEFISFWVSPTVARRSWIAQFDCAYLLFIFPNLLWIFDPIVYKCKACSCHRDFQTECSSFLLTAGAQCINGVISGGFFLTVNSWQTCQECSNFRAHWAPPAWLTWHLTNKGAQSTSIHANTFVWFGFRKCNGSISSGQVVAVFLECSLVPDLRGRSPLLLL